MLLAGVAGGFREGVVVVDAPKFIAGVASAVVV